MLKICHKLLINKDYIKALINIDFSMIDHGKIDHGLLT